MGEDRGQLEMRAESATHQTPIGSKLRTAANVMHHAEQAAYVAVGILLTLSLILAVAGGAHLLWTGAQDWAGSEGVYHIVDRLLFVLMLVEILHTVQASIRSGTLLCEPFLIVALIACIRRILVITLSTSQVTSPEHWKPEMMPLFQASMIEMGVLAVLIVVLVGSIWVVSRSNPRSEMEE